MPELPEVETMVRGVRPQLVHRTIEQTQFCRCTRKPIVVEPSRPTFRRKLQGAEILAVNRLAKRIMITLADDQYIVIEPRMTGLLLINTPPTQAHRRIQWYLNPVDNLAPSFEFWDRRGLGTVRLLGRKSIQELKNRLGPDPLTMPDTQWVTQLHLTHRPVKNALLDQKIVVGIGNIYASEILHRARVSPEVAADSISARRVHRIAKNAREILHEAIRAEGSTLGDGTYRNALNQDGSYQNKHRVYQKGGQICSSCRRRQIKRIVQAQRSTFFCPQCQKR